MCRFWQSEKNLELSRLLYCWALPSDYSLSIPATFSQNGDFFFSLLLFSSLVPEPDKNFKLSPHGISWLCAHWKWQRCFPSSVPFWGFCWPMSQVVFDDVWAECWHWGFLDLLCCFLDQVAAVMGGGVHLILGFAVRQVVLVFFLIWLNTCCYFAAVYN